MDTWVEDSILKCRDRIFQIKGVMTIVNDNFRADIFKHFLFCFLFCEYTTIIIFLFTVHLLFCHGCLCSPPRSLPKPGSNRHVFIVIKEKASYSNRKNFMQMCSVIGKCILCVCVCFLFFFCSTYPHTCFSLNVFSGRDFAGQEMVGPLALLAPKALEIF